MSVVELCVDGRPQALTIVERSREFRSVCGWSYASTSRSLHRRIKFAAFEDVVVALVRISVAAERMDHYPAWSSVYNVLEIHLTTHDAGGVTMLDFDLARLIDLIVAETQNYQARETENA